MNCDILPYNIFSFTPSLCLTLIAAALIYSVLFYAFYRLIRVIYKVDTIERYLKIAWFMNYLIIGIAIELFIFQSSGFTNLIRWDALAFQHMRHPCPDSVLTNLFKKYDEYSSMYQNMLYATIILLFVGTLLNAFIGDRMRKAGTDPSIWQDIMNKLAPLWQPIHDKLASSWQYIHNKLTPF
jgi:hypothetical protein